MLTGSCPFLSNFFLQIYGTLKLFLPLHKIISSMTFCIVRNVPFSFVQWSASKLVQATSTKSWMILESLWYCKLCIELKYPRTSTFKSQLFGSWNTNLTFKLSQMWLGEICFLLAPFAVLRYLDVFRFFFRSIKWPYGFDCRKNKSNLHSPVLVPWNRVHGLHDRGTRFSLQIACLL